MLEEKLEQKQRKANFGEKRAVMHIDILSLFPEFFSSPLSCSILGRAVERGLVKIDQVNIRDFSEDRFQRVDDRPFGGGPGMVMKPGPVCRAVESVKKPHSHVVFFSPSGSPLTAKRARQLSEKEHLILLAGHYEGIDQRAIDEVVDEEISIGDYVLTNGCLPALVLCDAVLRFIPGVLGDPESVEQDSFENGLLDHPHYTQPREFKGVEVPQVLLSGHHGQIKAWREAQGEHLTKMKRPDLWAVRNKE